MPPVFVEVVLELEVGVGVGVVPPQAHFADKSFT